MRLPVHMQHLSFLFPSILQVSCFLFMCALACTPADAVRSAPKALEPPHSAHHLHGAIRLPVYHKSFLHFHDSDHQQPSTAHKRGRGRRTLDPSPSSLSAPPPDQLRSELITLAEPLGQYFAKLQIGTPAQDIAVIIDTGSELMWIQCAPCLQCSPQAQEFPIFNRADSSSFQSLMCDAGMCKGDDGVLTGCTDSNACNYYVSYEDKSNSSGILAQELLTFTTSTVAEASSSVTLRPLVFGCGDNNMGVETQFQASGLMGLDRGMYSIISQLSIDVFSYCLPDRASSVDVSGYLTLGGAGKSSTSSSSIPPLQYTPMIQNKHSTFLSQFYYLTIVGVSVNEQILDVPAAAFAIDGETGMGGTFIDSGTTFTGFVEEAFVVIIEAFENAMGASYRMLDLGIGTPCYEVPSSKQVGVPAAPKVTIHLDGSVDMELGKDQLFYLSTSDTTNSYYCLAIRNRGPLALGARNVIGNYQQQDFLVEYDLAHSRIGIAPTQCSHP